MEPARDGQGGRSEGRAAPRRERTARKARRGDGKRPFVPRRCRARRAVTRSIAASLAHGPGDRKSVVEGKSVSVRVDLGGRRIIKKKTTKRQNTLYAKDTAKWR